ncbi:glycosyltransferase family 4 protein [Rhizobium oryzicola]|uniref:Glycosyltransferase family 4 protein n=1 Tax=Rhizobium oryzicola TaxID=1232668 RepID=A0ABT8SWQ8_9HYPH|nr:glycosyltransferase family 4 protein [Rhizobium oryzicola]MDO1582791.1 glycosyltransferase family 4 protein [Rhizobium oryzicola]
MNKSLETSSGSGSALKGRKVLIIVENLPVPFDRRVWQEARALQTSGAQVSIICPVGKGYTERYQLLEGIHIYRHPMPHEAHGAIGYLMEYAAALFWETVLSWKVLFKHGFDTLHGCNPPDLIFLIAWQFKLLRKRYIFDHHDINPELFEAKFGKRGLFWHLLRVCEWLTFKTADVVISTNESYRKIAIERGRKRPEDVFVVRSGPDLKRVKAVEVNPSLKKGRSYLVGYLGVMGDQEGIDLLLEAVAHLVHVKGRQDIHFALVGGGPALENLKHLAEGLRVANYVTFTGRAPDSLLFEVLSTSDVCVNPDRVNPMNDKSTMNKILEYMAIGKPIVQFEVTEGRYSAQAASLYAKANDPIDFATKIEELLSDPAKRAYMGDFGKRRVESEMAWSYEIPKLLNAYQAVART